MKTAAVFLLGLDPTNTTSTHLQDRALSSLTSSLSAPSGATSELWWRAQQAVPTPSVYLHPTKPGTVCPAGMGLSDGCAPPSNLQLFQAAQSHMLTRFHDFLLPSPLFFFFFFPPMEFPSVWNCAKQRAWDEETDPATNFCRQESRRNPCQTWGGVCSQHCNTDCGCCQKPVAFWPRGTIAQKGSGFQQPSANADMGTVDAIHIQHSHCWPSISLYTHTTSLQ